VSELPLLDNPIWNALQSRHLRWASTSGLASRYPAALAAFVGLREATPRAFADLRTLVVPGERAALFTAKSLDVPTGWQVLRRRVIDQMVCEDTPGGPDCELIALGDEDVPDMLALTAATEPGPCPYP
jgi:hypothetical protein